MRVRPRIRLFLASENTFVVNATDCRAPFPLIISTKK
jgi:hypothetical protein